MNEFLIAIIFIVSLFIVFPFIVYCIMVFINEYEKIHYMKDYIESLQKDDMKEYFIAPIINLFISIYVIFCIIIWIILKTISIIWNKIPKISVFENKCANIWRRFSNWFMNIKIK